MDIKQEAPLETWDIVIVGSGITSLAFASHLLSKHAGKKILMLEKHNVPGGYATVFKRGRIRYDCSLHKLAGLRSGNTRRMLEKLDLFRELDVVFHDTYFRVVHGDRAFDLPNNPEGFRNALQDEFPEDKEGLAVFFADVEVHGKNGYHQFQMMEGTYLPEVADLRFAHRVLKNITVSQALAERIKSPLLREILGAPSLYAGGYPDEQSYFYYLHIIYASLYCGTGYLVGGSQFLSDLLVSRIRKAGSAVRLRTNVLKVLVDENSRAYGVETDKGAFHGGQIVLNCSPHYSLERLFPKLESLEPVKRNLVDLAPSRSTTTLFCESDVIPEEFGLEEGETMIFPEDSPAGYAGRAAAGPETPEPAWESAFWSHCIIMVTNYHVQDRSGGKVVQLNILDSMDHWPHPGTGIYAEKKLRCQRMLLERFYRAFPRMRGHIIREELSSPHTYERYTNNHRGAGYGAMVGTNHKGHLFHRGFPIKNVHFMSSWVAGPSYEAAFGYAEMRANSFFA